MPMLMPLKTPSIGSSSLLFPKLGSTLPAPFVSKCPKAMLIQSLGVPSTIQVGKPKPESAAVACTGRLRDFAAPIQLCSCFGATTASRCPASANARDQFAEENAVDPVVISYQKMHTNMAARSEGGARGECQFRLTDCGC